MDTLTAITMAAILYPLSTHLKVWFCSHKNQQMPLVRLSDRLRFQMQQIYFDTRILGNFGSQGSVALSANPSYGYRQKFCSLKRCPQYSTEVNIMSQDKSDLSIPAQIEQEITQENLHSSQTTNLHINFSHRLDWADSEINQARWLSDATAPMMLRAKSVLTLISDIHQEAHINQLDPEQMCWVINSVLRELQDIEAVIDLDYKHRLQSQGGEA